MIVYTFNDDIHRNRHAYQLGRSGSGAPTCVKHDIRNPLLLMSRIFIQESSNHLLVLGVIFFCFSFKKINACFTESNGDLYSFVLSSKLFWSREKVGDNSHLPHRLISVFYFLFHIFFFLSANNQHRLF